MSEDKMTPKEKIAAVMAELGLTVESVFVPWSKSRNKGDKMPSLNWVVSLKRHGALVWSGDYGAGCAHCPSYVSWGALGRNSSVHWECEHGRWFATSAKFGKRIEPDVVDVVHSLVRDADAIDAGSFEEWASEFGYDTDSRKAEQMHNVCVQIGLKLRRAIGDSGLAKLREAAQDY